MLELFTFLVTIMGIAMSVSHLSQAYKIYKRKSAKDISLTTYSIFTLGSYIWLVYGFLIQDLPIIISFSIAVIGTTLVLVLTLRFR